MKRGVFRRVGALLTVVAASGCGDGTSTGALEFYLLERFEGTALPALAVQTGGVSSTVLDGAVLLVRGGTGQISERRLNVDEASPRGRVETSRLNITYEVRGTRIEITYVCPPEADCLPGPHLTGELVGNRLAIGQAASSKPASIYRRSN